MFACPDCFDDKELKGFISLSTQLGDCEICNSKNKPLVDISELHDFFKELIDNFQVSSTGIPLVRKIQLDWHFFSSTKVANKLLNILLPIISSKIASSKTQVDYADDIIENYSYWEKLKDEIKWKNRYITNIGYLVDELGWDGFFNSQYELSSSEKLFRARLHNQSGSKPFTKKEMLSPIPKNTNGGRANPSGIPFLYLSDTQETVLYEIRASYLDEISVGYFKTNSRVVKIVDFTEDTQLFQTDPNQINKVIKGKLLREIISKDLSTPMRRYDSDIEYVPTQFICEFIKTFTGADGIRFNSSLHPKGKNIVIFDQYSMKCTSVKMFKINRLRLEGIEI